MTITQNASAKSCAAHPEWKFIHQIESYLKICNLFYLRKLTIKTYTGQFLLFFPTVYGPQNVHLFGSSSPENLILLLANNKGKDQSAYPCSLISAIAIYHWKV